MLNKYFHLLDMTNGGEPEVSSYIENGDTYSVNASSVDNALAGAMSGFETIILIIMAIVFVIFAFRILSTLFNDENEKVSIANIAKNDMIVIIIILVFAAIMLF